MQRKRKKAEIVARPRVLTSSTSTIGGKAPTKRPLATIPAAETPPATLTSVPPTTLYVQLKSATAAGGALAAVFAASWARLARPPLSTRRALARAPHPTPQRSIRNGRLQLGECAPCAVHGGRARAGTRTERRKSAPAARRPLHAGRAL